MIATDVNPLPARPDPSQTDCTPGAHRDSGLQIGRHLSREEVWRRPKTTAGAYAVEALGAVCRRRSGQAAPSRPVPVKTALSTG
jgi:hypothetical protein